ncbi:MAG: shikimate kinase [Pseudomonadota bacterium]
MRKAPFMVEHAPNPVTDAPASRLQSKLAGRPLVLVGLMGAGKSAVGRRVAHILDVAFVDADTEIEAAADMTIADIFETYGEPEFRRLEASVMKRLLTDGNQIIATGGGAFMKAQTREAIAQHAVSVWLRADLDLLMDRVSRKQTRPLLKQRDPRGVMQSLMDERYPVYALADVTVESADVTKDAMAERIIDAALSHLEG